MRRGTLAQPTTIKLEYDQQVPLELTVQLDFRVFSEADAATASSRLAAAGFHLDDPSLRAESVRRLEALLRERGDERSFAWPSDAHVVSASITVSIDVDEDGEQASDAAIDAAEAKLDAAISPIQRDPELQWQIGRLDSIVRLD